jgi:hypothetical protein
MPADHIDRTDWCTVAAVVAGTDMAESASDHHIGRTAAAAAVVGSRFRSMAEC